MGTKVNITENSVTFISNDNIVTVVDNNSSTSTNITGTDITTVTVSAPGPKGDKGQNGNLFDIPSGNIIQPFTNITASGDISASGNLIAANLTISGDITSVGDDITLTDDLNLTSGAARIIFTGANGGATEGVLYRDSGGTDRYGLLFPGSNVVSLANRTSNGVVQIRANTSTAGSGGEVTVAEFQDNSIQLNTNITASGDISSSGTIDGGIYRSFGKGLGLYSSIGNTLALSSTDVITNINGTEITIGDVTHNKIINLKKSVTASSHISSSGTGSFTGGVLAGSHIIPTLSGSYDLGSSTKPWRELYVLSSSINFVGGDGSTEKFTKGDIENLREGKSIVSDDNKVSIAAAGNVPGASNLRNIVKAGAIVHPNFDAQAILMENQNEFGIILPRADVLYADFRNTAFYELLVGDKSGRTNLHFTGRTINFNGPVTASKHFRINNDLTVTGKITAEEFHTEFVSSSILFKSGSTLFGNSTDDVHEFVGDISGSSTTDLTLGGNITASGTMKFGTAGGKQIHTFFGKVKVDGSEVVIGEGHISASGNISSSGTVRALTGSFGSGTTHIHDSIQTAAISATGHINAATLQSQGTFTLGGTLNAGANQINAGGIVTPNLTATGKKLILGSSDNARQELTVYGRITQKGSELVIQSGSIFATGNVTASGDVSASGNVFAGQGGTGSFDHIITLDDTIEFRSKTNRDEIKGYAKFDPVEGLIAHSASYADNTRGPNTTPNAIVQMPKIANLLKKSNGTALTIGGVPFANNNTNQSIDLPGVNIAGNQNTSGTAASATQVATSVAPSKNTDYYVTLANSASAGNKSLFTDTGISFNPLTNLLTTTVTKALTGSLGGGHKGSNTRYWVTPNEFQGNITYSSTGGQVIVPAGRTAVATFTLPIGKTEIATQPMYVVGRFGTVQLYMHSLTGLQLPVRIASGNQNAIITIDKAAKTFNASTMYLAIVVTAPDDRDASLGASYVNYVTNI